jgi:hypothetical protein
MKGLVTILIFVFAVGFTASACAGAAAPKTQAACEKAGMHWDATASAPRIKCHFRLAYNRVGGPPYKLSLEEIGRHVVN